MNHTVKRTMRAWNRLSPFNRTLAQFSFISIVCANAVMMLISLILPEVKSLDLSEVARSTVIPHLIQGERIRFLISQ